jgi:hypothetical protein
MNDVQAHIQRATDALDAPLPATVVAEMATIALPAFMLEPTDDPRKAVVRFGGSPRVPEGFAWPARINDPTDRRVFPGVRAGQPLSFLADIDFARIVALHGETPSARLHGRLLVFIDFSDEGRGLEYGPDAMRPPHEQLFASDRDDVRFVHIPDGTACAEAVAPAEAYAWPRTDLAAIPTASLPPARYGSVPADTAGRDFPNEEIADAYHEVTDALTRDLGHQLLGFAPMPAQRDPRWYCPARSNWWHNRSKVAEWERANRPPDDESGWEAWRAALVAADDNAWEQGSNDPCATETEADWTLLAVFDSDDALGTMWGDDGELYLMIRKDDLASGRFDRIYLTHQCH